MALSMASQLLPIGGGGCHRAGCDPMLSFPQHIPGGRGFLCCLLLEENKKPDERGLLSLSEAEYSYYGVQPSEPRGTYTREA